VQTRGRARPGGEFEFAIATDVPRFGFDAPQPLTFTELVPAHEELIGVLKRCHNYIYGNQGLQKEPAFQELLKLIFCKVYDENTSAGKMRFFIGNEERRSEIGQRRLRETINRLFEDVKRKYQYIFGADEQIRLENRVLAYVVGELQRFSLLQTEADVKGAAYEQLVGANLRGDRGEFFTPRNVCKMAAEMAFATYPPERQLKLHVLDPACGTGGFLVAVMGVWREHLSLLPPGEWPSEPPNAVFHRIKPGTFDIVLTNPPFGSRIPIDDPHILEQFELARFELEEGQRRVSMPPEQLFIERCLYLLRPGGRLAIVLPDSILSNPGLAFIRRWILKRARLIASVDLPQVTFEPYTGTQTSVLLLQKKTAWEMQIEQEMGRPRDYEVFMTTPQAVGHDRRGKVHYLRTPEGELIEYEEEVPVYRRAVDGRQVVEHRRQQRKAVHDALPEVVHYFAEWVGQSERMRWLND
jgi:type I restriction enzyme M protein